MNVPYIRCPLASGWREEEDGEPVALGWQIHAEHSEATRKTMNLHKRAAVHKP